MTLIHLIVALRKYITNTDNTNNKKKKKRKVCCEKKARNNIDGTDWMPFCGSHFSCVKLNENELKQRV